MGVWVHGKAIMVHLADQIRTNLATSLSLEFVSVGKLYQLASKAAMADNLPCVLVSLDAEADVDAGNVGQDLVTIYPIRVVYARQFGDDEKVEETKAAALEDIANDLMDNRDLKTAGLTLTNALIANARLAGLEYTAAEEAEAREAGLNIVVAALTFMVQVYSGRS